MTNLIKTDLLVQLLRPDLQVSVPYAALLGFVRSGLSVRPCLFDLVARNHVLADFDRFDFVSYSDPDFPSLVGLRVVYEGRQRRVTKQGRRIGLVALELNGRSGLIPLDDVYLALPRPLDPSFVPIRLP